MSDLVGKVLVVDDQQQVIYALTRVLKGLGYEVVSASNISEALANLNQVDVAIFDIRLEEESGLDLLAQVRNLGNELPVIMLSAYVSPENLVMASRYGAVEILHKPAGVAEITEALTAAFSKVQPKGKEVSPLATNQEPEFIGSAPAMQEALKNLGLAAGNNLSVLLTGETGVGKDVSARLIHAKSARSEQPFVAVNTTAIPINLFEAELFGYAAGAFTGATEATPGLIESAEGGSLFLDEIGDFPLASQAKLLRFLEDKSFTRLGDATQRKADVRIIAATNQKLEEQISQGLFRQDLYFRLALIPIELPPLRQRKEDLPALLEFLVRQANKELGVKLEGITDEALAQARAHSWPGNIRELKNSVFRSCARLQNGWLTQLDITPASSKAETGLTEQIEAALEANELAEFLENLQKQTLSQALDFYGGNRTQLAEALKISRNTLRSRLKALGLDEE